MSAALKICNNLSEHFLVVFQKEQYVEKILLKGSPVKMQILGQAANLVSGPGSSIGKMRSINNRETVKKMSKNKMIDIASK